MIENFYNTKYLGKPITEAEYTQILNDDHTIIPEVCLVRDSEGYIETRYKPKDLYYYRYFAIEFLEDCDTDIIYWYKDLSFIKISFDYGLTWNNLTNDDSYHFYKGDKILLKNDGSHYINFNDYQDNDYCFTLFSESPCNLSGNIMSLFFGNKNDFWNGDTTILHNIYADGSSTLDLSYLFYENYGIKSAENLIIPIEPNENSYRGMFMDCYYMTKGPQLRFKTLSKNCLSYIFHECDNLESFRIDTVVDFINDFYWEYDSSPRFPNNCQIKVNPRLSIYKMDYINNNLIYNNEIKLVYDKTQPWFILRYHNDDIPISDTTLQNSYLQLYNYIFNNDYVNNLLIYDLYMYTGDTISIDNKVYYIFERKTDNLDIDKNHCPDKKYIVSTVLDFNKYLNGTLVYQRNNYQILTGILYNMIQNNTLGFSYLAYDTHEFYTSDYDLSQAYIYDAGDQLPLPLLTVNILRVANPTNKNNLKMIYQYMPAYNHNQMGSSIDLNDYDTNMKYILKEIKKTTGMSISTDIINSNISISQYILIDIIYYNYKKYYLWENSNRFISWTIYSYNNPTYLLSETYIFDDRYIWINNDIPFVTSNNISISLNCNMNYFPFIILNANPDNDYVPNSLINNIKNTLLINNNLPYYSSKAENDYLDSLGYSQRKYIFDCTTLYLMNTTDQNKTIFTTKKLNSDDSFFNNQLIRRIGPKRRYMVLSGDFYFNYHYEDDLKTGYWNGLKTYSYVGEITYNHSKYYAWEKRDLQNNFWGYILTKYKDFVNDDELFNYYILGKDYDQTIHNVQQIYILDYIYLTEDNTGYSQELLNNSVVYYLYNYETNGNLTLWASSNSNYKNQNKNIFAKDAYNFYLYNHEINDNYQQTIQYMLIGETIYESKPVYIWKAIKRFNNLDIYDGIDDPTTVEDYALTYENEFTDKDKMIVFNHNSLYCPTIKYSPKRRLIAYWEEIDEIPKIRMTILYHEDYEVSVDYNYSKTYDLKDFILYKDKVLYLWEFNFEVSTEYIQGNNDDIEHYKYWLLTPRYNYEVGDIFDDTEYSNTYIMGIDHYENGQIISGEDADNYGYKVISVTTYE